MHECKLMTIFLQVILELPTRVSGVIMKSHVQLNFRVKYATKNDLTAWAAVKSRENSKVKHCDWNENHRQKVS